MLEWIAVKGYSDIFKEHLKKHKLKYTTQRRAILAVLIEHQGEHLSTEEIYRAVKLRYPEIGLATVYRTLLLLERFELVYKTSTNDTGSKYSLIKNKEIHRQHHLICTKCGKVAEVKNSLLQEFEEDILRENGFIVKDHRVKFFGYCSVCADKSK